MGDFKYYEFVFNDGTTSEIFAENIYEAMEQIVLVNNVHPVRIKLVREVKENERAK